ncbi:hypothetical protein GCK72_006748 [Caenorhabditis remanei]|uniref:Uncharacterized protein n=1 Tax=Caenorhabditis remanei TaxID=31234 RepID=A0A6A5HFR1_CAERE|nr:hypothetical protein GCK72_006748 [Caenorhabditis remanei]KAF1766790.1 hypothetical protein GCK72_006748 [Caenorhabditis remanei]
MMRRILIFRGMRNTKNSTRIEKESRILEGSGGCYNTRVSEAFIFILQRNTLKIIDTRIFITSLNILISSLLFIHRRQCTIHQIRRQQLTHIPCFNEVERVFGGVISSVIQCFLRSLDSNRTLLSYTSRQFDGVLEKTLSVITDSGDETVTMSFIRTEVASGKSDFAGPTVVSNDFLDSVEGSDVSGETNVDFLEKKLLIFEKFISALTLIEKLAS